MIEKISNHQKLFLTELFKSRGKLSSYRIFKRLNCSFNDFSRVYRRLEEQNLVTSDEHDNVSITIEGRAIVIESVKQKKLGAPWKDVPNEFKREAPANNNYYVPNVSKLDKKTFLT